MSSGLSTAATAGTPVNTTAAPPTSSGPAASNSLAPVTGPAPVLTPAELSTAVRDLTLAVQSLQKLVLASALPSQGPRRRFRHRRRWPVPRSRRRP